MFTKKHRQHSEPVENREQRRGLRRRRKPVGAIAPAKPTRGLGGKAKWHLRSVAGHITFIGPGGAMGEDRMIAWYLADPQQYSFRSNAEVSGLIGDQAAQLADLVGTTVYIRVTHRPYPVGHWAQACYRNAPEPQDGFAEMMDLDQVHMSGSAQVDKLVYYGIDLGNRGAALAVLSKINAGVVDREMAALNHRMEAVNAIAAGPGLDAWPASPAEMEWLLARSFALGCPVPVPALDEHSPTHLDADDLASFVSTTSWSGEPLAPTMQVTTSVNGEQVTRHVVTLTVSRIEDIEVPERHEPWMAKADKLPWAVEWSGRVDVRTAAEISKEMSTLSNRVDGQVNHWRDDHGKRPPKQLARQAQRTADVEDEMRTGFTGMSTRTKGWYRLAVSGATEAEALERAQALIALYKPQIKLVRELGQYHLAREFVPGEPLASTAHSRKFPVLKVAAGLPAITAEVGDKRGHHIGSTIGLSSRAVCFDPWFLPEVMECGGLVPIVGGLGSGKSLLAGVLTYKAVLSGVRAVVIDPAGRMQNLLKLPEIRKIARSVDVIGGQPGSLSPYSVVPDPKPALVRLMCEDPENEDEFEDRMAREHRAAESRRRDLSFNTLRWCLPLEMGRDPEVRRILRQAINRSQARAQTSANEIVSWLLNRDKAGDIGQEIASELETAKGSELGRLFFHEMGQRHGPVEVEDARLVVFNLRGLVQPSEDTPLEDYSAEELLVRPILTLTSWAASRLIYREDPNERKLFVLDEAQEITESSSAGKALIYKISSDSRKNNTVALVLTQNAANVLGKKSINNFVGAAFVGRTGDEEAQRDALKLLGKPEAVGYEAVLGKLSQKRRTGEFLPYREFIYRDGLGGEGGRGGMEKIRISVMHHPKLFAALDTTPKKKKRPDLSVVEEQDDQDPSAVKSGAESTDEGAA